MSTSSSFSESFYEYFTKISDLAVLMSVGRSYVLYRGQIQISVIPVRIVHTPTMLSSTLAHRVWTFLSCAIDMLLPRVGLLQLSDFWKQRCFLLLTWNATYFSPDCWRWGTCLSDGQDGYDRKETLTIIALTIVNLI